MAGVTPVSVRLDEDVLAQVRERANRERKSQADWLRDAVQSALSAPPPGEEPVRPISPREALRAGQLAGLLEGAYRSDGTVYLGDETGARAWLDAHPVGASFVAELLATAGLGEAFRRWRGVR